MARKQHVFEAHADVAHAAGKRAGLIVKRCERYRHLELIARAEAMFVHELVGDVGRVVRADRRGDDGLVLRKRLLRRERPRQVELAAGPRRVAAESAQMRDDRVDLRRCQLLGERRHDPGKPASAAAVVNGRLPVDVQFRGR